jgi:hydrogenase maturation factor
MTRAYNTGSTLSLDNGVNKTSTAISTNIIIMVNDRHVGAVQSLNISEQRTIKMVDEVGTDGHIDSVPNGSTKIAGSCKRIRFDRLRITEAFSRGFIHIASQVYPFDIVILDKQKRDERSQISTVIKNVWISQIQYAYEVGDWVIADTMNWEAETIFSVLNGSNTPVAVGGEIGVKHMGRTGSPKPTDIEQDVDTGSGGRRGSLDAAGLIDIGSSGNLF